MKGNKFRKRAFAWLLTATLIAGSGGIGAMAMNAEDPQAGENVTAEETVTTSAQDSAVKKSGVDNQVEKNTETPDNEDAASPAKQNISAEKSGSESESAESSDSENGQQSNNENGNDATKAFDFSGSTEAVDVTASSDAGAFEAAPTMTVTDASEDSDRAALEQAITSKKKIIDFKGVDITFTDKDGNTVQPTTDKNVKVTLTLKEALKSAAESDNSEIAVYRKHENDTAKIENPEISDDQKTITFTVSEFSKFYVARIADADPAIYLDGANGNDANEGQTKETAVKTFEKAKELATENTNIKTIYVTGTVDIENTVSLDETDAVLMRADDFKGYLLQVPSGKEATLDNITIDGNSEKATETEKSLIYVSGTLNISDGAVLQNNKIKIGASGYSAEGGAVYASKATVNMTGGTIKNNVATFGGGILVEWSTLNMSGGEISGNKAVNGTNAQSSYNSTAMAAGGGIAALATSGGNGTNGEAIINLSGGIIKNNISDETGGGISLGYQMVFDKEKITLNMTGGTIDSNEAGSSGGGIFVQAGNTGANAVANVSGGRITNNKLTGQKSDGSKVVGNAAFGGGGIYVNGYNQAYHGSFDNGVLNLTNAIITDNSAGLDGGGYASCPASETHIYITEGAAFYSNTAKRHGDEIFILGDSDTKDFGAHYGNPYYTVSPVMLGGTAYKWKYDYGESDGISTAKGETGTEVALNDLDSQLDGDKKEALALSTDQKGNGKTERLEKVVISGNTSTYRGGGIGSNGTVNIGLDPEKKTEVDVTKEWADGLTADSNNIRINLYRYSTKTPDEEEYVGYLTLTPNTDNVWKASYKELSTIADDGGDYVYTIGEANDGTYTYAITDTKTEEGKTSFTIKNYSAATSDPHVSKKLTGDKPSENETFTFTITPDKTSYPVPKDKDGNKVTSVKITGEGTAEFGTITFPQAGTTDSPLTYTYTVKEEAGTASGYTYDTAVYELKYEVSEENGNITLKKYIKKGSGDWEELESGKTETVEFTNSYSYTPPTPSTSTVTLIKTDAKSGERLSGASFDLYRSNRTKVGNYTTNANGEITVEGLAYGSYYFVETSAPAGYVQNNDRHSFTLDAQTKNPYEIKVTNTKRETPTPDPTPDPKPTPSYGSVKLIKTDAQTGGRLSGVSFDLYRANGTKVGSYTTDANGTITVTGLTYDSYYFTETAAPKGYVQNTDKQNFTLNAVNTSDGKKTLEITVANTKKKTETAEISGTKSWVDYDNIAGKRPDMVTLHLFANGKEIASTQISSADSWKFSFGQQPLTDEDGNTISYTITEDAITDYTFSQSTPQTINGTMTINVTNTYTGPIQGDITLIKTDAQTGDKLSGASFDLYTADGKTKVGSYTTDENGLIKVTNLKFGDYYFTETAAPEGYKANTKKISFTISAANTLNGTKAMEVTVSNTKKTVKETVKISGTKTWKDSEDKAGKRPEMITVHLLANGEEIKSAQVTADDDWTYDFGEQPVNDENGDAIDYTISEDKVAGYTFSQADPETKDGVMTIAITNTYKTKTPDKPNKNNPTTPKKSNTVTPTQTGGNNTTSTTSNQTHSVKTGDIHAGMYVGIIIAAAAVLVVVAFRRRRIRR